MFQWQCCSQFKHAAKLRIKGVGNVVLLITELLLSNLYLDVRVRLELREEDGRKRRMGEGVGAIDEVCTFPLGS